MSDFIKNRLNKDNFWNLMFGLIMSSGFSLALFIGPYVKGTGFGFIVWLMFLFTIITAVRNLLKNNKITAVSDKKFLNSEGINITKRVPFSIIWCILFTPFFTYTAFTYVSEYLLVPSFFFAPSMYFILINCPISVLFNKKVWNYMSKHNEVGYHHKSSHSTLDRISSPQYRYLPNNIHCNR